MQSKNTFLFCTKQIMISVEAYGMKLLLLFPLYYINIGHGSLVKTQLSFVPKAEIHSFK